METKFNVFEILEIAERVENRGARFYLRTMELFADPELRDIYYKLANRKAKNEKIWTRMRKRFSEKTGEFGTFDPDNYVLSNPEVMAGLTWVAAKPGSTRRLTGREGKEEILKDAISRENEIVVFYQGLKDFARDPASEDTIDKIIREENRQVQFLTELSKQS